MAVFTNRTQIANLALSHVGANNTVDAFSERSVEAAQMRVWYDFSRKIALSAFDWNFCRKRIELAAHSEAPPLSVWGFRYQYPADCLVARKIEYAWAPPANAVPFTVETESTGQEKTILTDLAGNFSTGSSAIGTKKKKTRRSFQSSMDSWNGVEIKKVNTFAFSGCPGGN